MTLEALIEDMHTVWDTKFISRTERAKRLATVSSTLDMYVRDSLAPKQLYELDALYVRLRRSPHHELYAETLERVQGIRSQHREAGPHIATGMLQATGVRYEQRFAAVEAYLQEGTYTFDDIALAIDSLDSNAYVRRRAKTDAVFAQRVQHMRESLTTTLLDMKERDDPKPKTSYWSRVKSGVLQAGITAATAAIFVPTSIYATFFQ